MTLRMFGRDILRLVPVVFVPFLKDLDVVAHLDVQLDVVGQPGHGEVAGSYQGHRSEHRLPGVGDVGLCVKLLLGVDLALDLAFADRLHYGRHPGEKVVLLLRTLYALIEGALHSL